jgi:folate-binding Fe-S cluster repair protein YgfZ
MNAISLKKGCFLGQEIVSRGLLAGIVRRRAFPYVLRDNNQIIPTGSIIKSNEE